MGFLQEKDMTTKINGVYRNGNIILNNIPSSLHEETHVIVIYTDDDSLDLKENGINEKQATELREQFTVFSEDWDSPDMSIYDDYDKAKAK